VFFFKKNSLSFLINQHVFSFSVKYLKEKLKKGKELFLKKIKQTKKLTVCLMLMGDDEEG
jgi:hypothetical protein